MTKYRKKRRALPVVIVCILLAAVITVAGYFGYDRWERYTHPIKYEDLLGNTPRKTDWTSFSYMLS